VSWWIGLLMEDWFADVRHCNALTRAMQVAEESAYASFAHQKVRFLQAVTAV
jgi:hypothetical protein